MTSEGTTRVARTAVHQLWPLLFVNDIERSVQFYTTVLGFMVAGRADSGRGLFWCRLQRGGACFMLQQKAETQALGSPPAPEMVLYFVCDDAAGLFAEFSSKGLSLEPPSVAYYGMLQLFVPDPDGYAICFESPTEAWSG